jgi:hypothetical protein
VTFVLLFDSAPTLEVRAATAIAKRQKRNVKVKIRYGFDVSFAGLDMVRSLLLMWKEPLQRLCSREALDGGGRLTKSLAAIVNAEARWWATTRYISPKKGGVKKFSVTAGAYPAAARWTYVPLQQSQHMFKSEEAAKIGRGRKAACLTSP